MRREEVRRVETVTNPKITCWLKMYGVLFIESIIFTPLSMPSTAVASLQSLSLYSQSRAALIQKKAKETSQDFEVRTWARRLHTDDEGVFVPPMAFRNCVAECAKFLSIQIPGKGKSTYTKHFESGILVPSAVPIYSPLNRERIIAPSEIGLKVAAASNNPDAEPIEYDRPPHEVYGNWIFTPADGVAGSGKRVWKCYPIIQAWQAKVTFLIMDDTITEDVFKNVLTQAGMLIGIGRFRVRNRGTYGRFGVTALDWKEGLSLAA